MIDLNLSAQPVEAIAALKARVDIGDFIGRYVKLKRSGPIYTGLCPFHAERTPSFHVSPRWQNFKCWGCSVTGDVIDFVGALENLSPGQAIGRFRELVGGVLSAGNMAALQLPAQFRQIIICADAEPVGIEAGLTLARRLRAEGREARVIVPEVGKDANDVLLARAA